MCNRTYCGSIYFTHNICHKWLNFPKISKKNKLFYKKVVDSGQMLW